MNKIVVISGTSSGIGRELAALYESNGDTVIGLSRSEDKLLHHFNCDITDEARVKECIDEIYNVFNRIDILINNAGIGISGATEILKKEETDRVMAVNYFGTYNLCRACLKYMVKGAKIVNISSACAIFPLPYRTVYCASKAAVNMLSMGLRMELKPCGIDVITICPGDIKSNFTKNRLKNIEESERYGLRPSHAQDKIDSREDKRMDINKAVKKIYKIATYKKGALYIIGKKYKFLNFLKHIVPMSTLIKFTDKHFGGHK